GNLPDSPPGTAMSGFPDQAGGSRTNATAVKTSIVERKIIRRTFSAGGDVLAGSSVAVYSDIGGKILNLEVNEGDPVKTGEVIAFVDPSRPGEKYTRNPVASTVDGTVTALKVSNGDAVSTQTPVAVVSDLKNLRIIADIPERYAGYMARGMPAVLTFGAFPGKTFEAIVTAVNPRLNAESRTMRIEMRMKKENTDIKAGMYATVSLVVEQRIDVPAVPVTSLITYDREKYVFVIRDNIALKTNVTTGLEDDEYTEITAGLKPGDRIVTKGQSFLSDGDPVAIIGEE
ncbi:MAG: efflux RND transporter periplasmic adaptor subunit, partial [Spirochaetales bacterium]|nr:efflux RND transporter periplasmic adaptor subunit [Spirochaetales bacterium]